MKNRIKYPSLLLPLTLIPGVLIAGEPGKLKREVWTGIGGNSVSHLTGVTEYFGAPNLVEAIDGAEAPTNWGENYGQRLRGYIVAPESGDYTFWIAGDDHCELYLSSDGSKFNAGKIASVSGWTAPQQWDKYASQKSATINLVAGQKYFVQVLHKEGGGGDNLAIAWKTPSGQQELIPASALESFTVDPDDADDDGLKDSFESAHGLSILDNGSANPDNGPLGDPDKDGYLNIEEQEFGTNPTQHGGVPGHLSYERWNTGYGVSILDLKSIPSFYGVPNSSEIIAGAETPVNSGNNYGARLSGYIIAPVTGDYTFWVAGDDNVELSLSSDSSKFSKQRIAWHKGWTSPRQWDRFASQKSTTVSLVAGEKYYIEALVKEWGGGDHLSIAWQTPGGQREVIPASALESAASDLNDQDNDGLKDDWELSNSLDATTATGDNGAQGDPDGDFAPNWLEQAAGTDPNVVDNAVPGALVYEQWNGIPGRFVKDLKKSSKFLQSPDARYAVVTGTGPFNNQGDIGNRVRGYITAPVTGDYTFWAEGNKEVELWLSTDEDKFNKQLLVRTAHFTAPFNYNYDISQKSKAVHLVEGQKYYLECYHKINNKSGNHFTFAWQIPGGSREQIDSSVLSTFHRQANDQDDDDLKDDYELANGLDPSDNGSVNPANGAYGDLDGDGLLNHEEQAHGTAANNADTDGDGVSDFDEIKLLETQALVGDVAPFQSVQTIAASAYTDSLGTWESEGNLVYHTASRGWLEYTVNLPAAGVYMLDLELGPYSGGNRSDEYETVFSVNGEYCERVHSTIAEGATGHAKILTPWLPAGANTVRVLIDNSLRWRKVGVRGLSVLSSHGGDTDGNGTPDWVDSRLSRNNGIDTGITQSQVSPAYLEGRARYHGLAQAVSATLTPAPGERWFTRVDLDSTGQPITQRISFENGGLVIDRSLTWTATNLLVQENMTLRQGDALRLTAFNGGAQSGTAQEAVTVQVEGQSYDTTADIPVVHTFNTPGEHTVTATHLLDGIQTSRSIVVTVQADAPVLNSPVCVQGFWREWDVPALPAGAILELDESVEVRETIDLGAAGTRYVIQSTTAENSAAVIRMGEGGAVIGSTTIRGMRVRDAEETAVYFAGTLEGGGYITEMPVIVDGMTSDVTLRYDIFIGGVTFEDGSLSKDYNLGDFDELGIAKVRMLKSGNYGSICHRGSVWQDGKRIAWFY